MIQADSLIFDLDGTLWDATDASLMAWNKAALAYEEKDKLTITKNTLEANFGLTLDVIANNLLSAIAPEKRDEFMKSWIDIAHELITDRQGTHLFEKVEETLSKLGEKHELYIVSNCEKDYIPSFYAAHGLEKYFKDYECWGRTLLPKSGSIKTLMRRNNIVSAAYIGDTQTDMIAAREAEIPFVFAAYGFGTCTDCDAKALEFADLCKIFI